MASKMVILLASSTPSTIAQDTNQAKVRDWLNAFKIDFKEVDGADAANKEVRTELFSLSGIKGVYPQVFITDKASKTEFIGDYDKLLELVEANGTPADVAAKAGIQTFEAVFASCKKS